MDESKPAGRTVEECLRLVEGFDTFRTFLWTLVDEREAAEEMERSDPKWKYGGAHGWQNSTISTYLGAAMHHFESQKSSLSEHGITWRDLAEFLYTGKIYE